MKRTRKAQRILQVIEASLGGTRRYLEDVFGALGPGQEFGLAYSLRRADAAFLTLLERLRQAGWALYELDMTREIDVRRDLACTLELRSIYRRFNPDVVHAHSSKAGALARLAAFGFSPRLGIVYTPHSISAHLHPMYSAIERVLALRLDMLAAVTMSEARQLRGLHLVAPNRITVIPPAIRGDFYTPRDRIEARRSLRLADRPTVVSVGRLAPQKDPLQFLDFVAILRKRVPSIQAIWVGDGELRPTMEQRITDLGLADIVTVTGWQDDVRPYLAACDLLVSTSAYESFGYVTAEALAMSRPVVASAITGTVDIVTTDTDDQLYPYRDLQRAASLAERLLADPHLAGDVAGRGRQRVITTFSPANMRHNLALAYAVAVQP